jgi:hypothetical protein
VQQAKPHHHHHQAAETNAAPAPTANPHVGKNVNTVA